MRAILFGVSLLFAPLLTGGAAAQDVSPLGLTPKEPDYEVTEILDGEKEDKPRGISGIACLPAAGAVPRRCLVVNDERRKAQLVTIENNKMAPGKDVGLIGKDESESTLGQKPNVTTCPGGPDDFDDLDGEGVAYAAPYFYVVGSHGCSRNKGKFKLSSFILARVRVDAGGKPSDDPETTYRLSDVLGLAPTVRPFFGKELMRPKGANEEPNGLNIEGIAVIGDQLFVGLRAPSIKGQAFVVRASVADLFANEKEKKHARSQAVPELIPLPLGENVGIRDLTPLPNGQLLILAGPAQEQKVPYSLFVAEPRGDGLLKKIGVLKKPSGEDEDRKAEAVTLLGPDRVLILFDGVLNGGPREYRLASSLY
jgi:uncharacterized protein DUF3616